MMRSVLFLATLLLAGNLEATSFVLDPAHSSVGFKVKHMMISTVPGHFKTFSGGFDFDPDKGQLKDVSVTIDAASVDTGVEMRDKHLRSTDFFNANEFPTEIFVAKGPVTVVANQAVKLSGTLTLRGVSKRVVLDVIYGGSMTEPKGGRRVAFEATTTINRMDYGVSYNKTLDQGGVMVSEEVKLDITGEASLVENAQK
jgi:polyisoprenoid-binding protein YceI